MSCILRISGEALDIEALLLHRSLVPNRTWRKGEERAIKGKAHSDSGVSFVASDADFDEFERQLTDANEFLETHASEIAAMAATPGVKYATLDFGVSLYKDSVAQFCSFPPKFVRLAASAGLGLEVSMYACSDDTSEG
jgi:hypothetical protein